MKRIAQIAFAVWFVAVGFRYSKRVLVGLTTPLNIGNDFEWLLYWLAIIASLAILAFLIPRFVKLLPVILTLIGVTITIASGTFLDAAIACWLLLLAYAWGQWIFELAGLSPDGSAQRISIGVSLGLVPLAFAGYFLGYTHLLTPWAIWLAMAILTACQARRILAFLLSLRSMEIPAVSSTLPVLTIAALAVLNLLWAVAPEVQYDASNYHLNVPKVYLEHSGFVDIGYYFHSYFFFAIDCLYAMALALHGPAVAKLLSFGVGLVAACGVYCLGTIVFDSKHGLWAAAFYYTTPLVAWLSTTAYIDHAVAMLLTTTLVALLQFRNSRCDGWLYVSAVLAGATIATKMNGAFGLPVAMAMEIWITRRIKPIAICSLVMLAIAAPWFVNAYRWTGNPVFPMLNGVFKSPMWEAKNNVMNARVFGLGFSLASLPRIPLWLTFETSRFGEVIDGCAGIALLVALPFSLALLRIRRSAAPILLGVTGVFLLLWAFSFQYARYYVHILPVVCVLAVGTVFHFSETSFWERVSTSALSAVLILQFAPVPIQYWQIPERFPLRVAAGLESREQFLSRALSGYESARHLNRVVKPGERVLGVDTEHVRFYLNPPMVSLLEAPKNSELLRLPSLPPDDSLRKELLAQGIRFIFVERDVLRHPPAWHSYLAPSFLARFTKWEASDPTTIVYRIRSEEGSVAVSK